jgi:hypothetical protein
MDPCARISSVSAKQRLAERATITLAYYYRPSTSTDDRIGTFDIAAWTTRVRAPDQVVDTEASGSCRRPRCTGFKRFAWYEGSSGLASARAGRGNATGAIAARGSVSLRQKISRGHTKVRPVTQTDHVTDAALSVLPCMRRTGRYAADSVLRVRSPIRAGRLHVRDAKSPPLRHWHATPADLAARAPRSADPRALV